MASPVSILSEEFQGADFQDLANAPLEALTGVSDEDRAALKRALKVKTIGELGRHPLIATAVAIATLARTSASEGGAERRDEDDLIARYIERNPNHPGPADVRLIDSCVPVWALAGQYRALDGDAEQLAADYALPGEAVEAALAYYRRHRAVIDARIAANLPFEE